MKKITLMILAIAFTSIFVNAQKEHLVESKYSNIKSLMFDNETSGFLIYEHGGRKSAVKSKSKGKKTSNIPIKFTVYNKDMEEVADGKFNINKSSKIHKVVANASTISFAMIDYVKGFFEYKFFDRSNGEEIYTKTFTRKANKDLFRHLETPGLSPALYPANEGFYFVSYEKKYRDGYTIKKIDDNFKTLWTKRVNGGKKDVNMYANLKYQNGSLVLVNAQKPKILSKNVFYSVELIDDESGETQYNYVLNDKNNVYMPNQIIKEADGSVAVGGVYFEGEKIKSQEADGLFLLKLDENGKKDFVNLTNWRDKLRVAAKEQSKEFDIFQGAIRFFCQNIIKNGDNYDMVIEMFRKDLNEGKAILLTALRIAAATASSGGNVTANVEGNSYQIELLDFLVLSINKNNGKLVGNYFIKKEKDKVDIPEDLIGVGSFKLIMANPAALSYVTGSRFDSDNPYFLYGFSKNKVKSYNIVSLVNDKPIKKTIDFLYPSIFNKAEVSSFKKMDDNNLLFYTFSKKIGRYTFWLEKISDDYVAKPKTRSIKKETVKEIEKVEEIVEESSTNENAKEKLVSDVNRKASTKSIERVQIQIKILEKQLDKYDDVEIVDVNDFEELSIEELEKQLEISDLKLKLEELKGVEEEMLEE